MSPTPTKTSSSAIKTKPLVSKDQQTEPKMDSVEHKGMMFAIANYEEGIQFYVSHDPVFKNVRGHYQCSSFVTKEMFDFMKKEVEDQYYADKDYEKVDSDIVEGLLWGYANTLETCPKGTEASATFVYMVEM